MIRTSSLIITARTTEPCGECIEVCQKCLNKNSLDLHHEIEELKAKLADSNNRMIQMELDFVDGQRSLETENTRTQDELIKLRDRYDRLMDSHKKLQRLNHNLECKLLTVVEQLEEEKQRLSDHSLGLNLQLLESKVTICDLKEELDRYRQDCNIAVQLLQCKPSNFVPHKLTSLPPELQQRVKLYLSQRQTTLDLNDSSHHCQQRQRESSSKIIRVPMATFPPTAIVYSVNRVNGGIDSANDSDVVIPSAVMARVLTKPGGTLYPSGRVVVCRHCLAENSVADSWTQTRSRSSTELSFSSSGNEGDPVSEHSPPRPIQSHEEPHPKVHRLRYNSVESQN